MLNRFTDHPASVGETYFQHLSAALGFALRMFMAAGVCSVHAFLPFLFEKKGSAMIAELYECTGPGRVKEGRKPLSSQEAA